MRTAATMLSIGLLFMVGYGDDAAVVLLDTMEELAMPDTTFNPEPEVGRVKPQDVATADSIWYFSR